MSGFAEYEDYDGLGLAQLVKAGEVTAEELLDSAIERIEQRNPALNAVIHTFYDKARQTARRKLPNGRFAGVPFLLKDLLAAYAGEPMTRGSRAYRHAIPEVDSELVRRFKKAGVVILGKTNTPEFGCMGVTEPELHGATRNPWDTGRTPGGSSGGTAAAVAAGMVPIASAGDGGGSIRIPASCCGLFGLKPSRGRNPTGPELGEIWQGATVEHILSRSVRDSAAMLDATLGDDSGAPYTIARPRKSYLSCLADKPRPLRIAFSTASPIGTAVHAECRTAVAETARLLQELGHAVEEQAPPIDGQALAASYITLYFGEMAEEIRCLPEALGRPAVASDVEATTWLLAQLGKAVSAGEFVRAMKEWHRLGRIMGKFHETYDLLLTPTMAFPPVRIGELKPKPGERLAIDLVNRFNLASLLKRTGMINQMAEQNLAKMPFTQLANLTGQPAMSLPLHWSRDNLPIGVQFIAPIGREDILFRLAGQLELARPWFRRRPALTA